ncbi:MAG: hypothetical protein Q8K78_08395 [Planctomycetaceae bacterium]|nr:hypothetical protein [Planctomycetaceae bacterium]
MGWEVHATRATDWINSSENPITTEEWLRVVADDPELKIDDQNSPYFAVWSGPCSYPKGSWFDWHDGQIHTKNPDQAILGKLLEIAAKLGAVVQGDDGEIYRCADDLK